MAYLVKCNQCDANATLTGPMKDPDGAVVCGCCPEDHDHAAAANACPGGHDGQPCPLPAGACSAGEACQGGHCGLGVAGCTVCRPVTITALGDSARLAMLA